VLKSLPEHVAFFTISLKLTMEFAFTKLLLNFYTSVSGCGCCFRFEQKYWPIDGIGEKRHFFHINIAFVFYCMKIDNAGKVNPQIHCTIHLRWLKTVSSTYILMGRYGTKA